VVESLNKVAEVAKTTMQLGLNEYTAQAKAFIVILEEYAELMSKIASLFDSQLMVKGDLGAVSLALCLEAESQGLGTCILGLIDRPKLRELLDIPREKPVFLVIAVGYPARPTVRNKQRKSVKEIARYV
jgi:nitroreductase